MRTDPFPSNAASVTVTASCTKTIAQFKFTVFPPTDVDHAKIVGTNHYATNTIGAGMEDQVVFAPTSVSLSRVTVTELECPATGITGYFTNNTDFGLSIASMSIDSDNSTGDGVSSSLPNPHNLPLYPGAFEIDTPTVWQITGSSQTNSFKQFPSYFKLLDSSGTFSAKKYGLTITRSTNDVSN